MKRTFDVGPRNYTDEWHAMRVLDENRNPPVVCGASEAGVICGVSKYKTALQLYMEKRALVEPKVGSENMEWGKRLEPAILDEYTERTGITLIRPDHLLLRSDRQYVGASPDGMAANLDADICVDAKITTFRMFDAEHCRDRDCFGEGIDDIPSDYLMQAHQQMYVTGTKRCDFPVLFDGNRLRIYSIERDDEIVDHLVRSVSAFVDRVVGGFPPEPDWNHDTTVSLMKRMHGIDKGVEIMLSDKAADLYDKWVSAKHKIGMLTKEKEMATAKILHEMGEAQCGIVPERGAVIVRTEIADLLWSHKDIEEATKKTGSLKRRGYIRITERKAK